MKPSEPHTTQSEALGWLIEMERLQDPATLNALVLNTFKVDRGIKNTEFIVDEKAKKLLVFVELSWWARKFRARLIREQVESMLTEILPSYRLRVTSDAEILAKAKAIMARIEEGMAKALKAPEKE